MANDAGQDLQRHGKKLDRFSDGRTAVALQTQDVVATIFIQFALNAFDMPRKTLHVVFYREATKVPVLANFLWLLFCDSTHSGNS
jgi:hypothetical protein